MGVFALNKKKSLDISLYNKIYIVILVTLFHICPQTLPWAREHRRLFATLPSSSLLNGRIDEKGDKDGQARKRPATPRKTYCVSKKLF